MDKQDIGQMIEDCQNVAYIDRMHGGPGFNDWERNFIESIAEWYDENDDLTDAQYQTLKKIWDKIE